MHPLLTFSYWFSLQPAPFQPGIERALLVLFGIFFAAGIIVWVMQLRGGYDKLMKKAIGRLATHLGWTGFVGLCLWAMEYERVPLLRMRVLYILWGVWVLVGLWFIVRYVWKEIPVLEAQKRERTAQSKWLPTSKKR
ncbi:MAG: hypothetical protein RL141_529 [Candidatus Parcubacteria bacterium]|jgi:hypothetical protein